MFLKIDIKLVSQPENSSEYRKTLITKLMFNSFVKDTVKEIIPSVKKIYIYLN